MGLTPGLLSETLPEAVADLSVESFAFVMNIGSAPPETVEIEPGLVFRRANTTEITTIKGHLRDLSHSVSPMFSGNLWETPLERLRGGLPAASGDSESWRYFV